jgi:hypothetical protein
MEQIATQLGVTQGTISNDLRGLLMVNKPLQRPWGGRPKGGNPRRNRTKADPAVQARAAELYLDQGLTREEVVAETGLPEFAVRAAVERERGRREAKAELEVHQQVSRRSRRGGQRIPDVMRDDWQPQPPSPRKRVSDLALTPEQVDPDFKGTPLEFVTKYGHVNLHTKAEIEHHKQQDALNTWLGAVATFERSGCAMLESLAAVDPTILQEWKSKPGKIKKLQDWYKSVQFACESLRDITK